MDDLISRSKVIDVLKQTGIIVDNDLGHLIVEEIERIPTAYDVEGVVSELQYIKESFEKDCSYWKEHSWRDNTVYNEADLNERQADCYSDAIEIVRKGGVE